ncbi:MULTISPECIES: deoxyribose-phosphate aldolase [unclassified Actinomyces]|uniref:deoxyribose-phosphate aldolase n=1 Tax=unclassified Actinomyces TaxID=2609248 RepID=UPI000D59D18A|nr:MULTISPECIES: deoxyribose-phosphate aldolase [unclassified Actinomyces]RAX20556.1 deoxyribose-phosphate aldolase [Actinomyces sp. Z3]
MPTRAEVAAIIDHTLLKPEATGAQIADLVAQGAELGTYSVCVSPNQLPVQAPAGLHVATVCGFPSGAHASSVKAAEAADSVAKGADEVDMVVNLKLVKEHDYEGVEADIHAVKEAVGDKLLKVIIESAVLTDDEIVAVCQAAERAGADYVKTSTGFHPAGGASVHAVELMRATVGDRLGVKASGGIRTAADALAMIEAGASRLGVSATVAILEGLPV